MKIEVLYLFVKVWVETDPFFSNLCCSRLNCIFTVYVITMYTINICAHSITYSYTLYAYSYHIYMINKCRRGDKSSKPDGRTLDNKRRRNLWGKNRH